jgi:hypothetical protein
MKKHLLYALCACASLSLHGTKNVQGKNYQRVKAHISNGGDPNHIINTMYKETLLHEACEEGSTSSVEYLLSLNADPYARETQYGDTPLHRAVDYGHFDIVKKYVQKGLSIDVTNKYGMTPLHSALRAYDITIRNVAMFDYLCKHTKNINKKAYADGTPLSLACRLNKDECVSTLLKYKADTEICDTHTDSPLYHAIKERNSHIVTLLLQHNASFVIPFKKPQRSFNFGFEENPSHIRMLKHALKSVGQQNSDIITTFLAYGCDIDPSDMEQSIFENINTIVSDIHTIDTKVNSNISMKDIYNLIPDQYKDMYIHRLYARKEYKKAFALCALHVSPENVYDYVIHHFDTHILNTHETCLEYIHALHTYMYNHYNSQSTLKKLAKKYTCFTHNNILASELIHAYNININDSVHDAPHFITHALKHNKQDLITHIMNNDYINIDTIYNLFKSNRTTYSESAYKPFVQKIIYMKNMFRMMQEKSPFQHKMSDDIKRKIVQYTNPHNA